MNILLKPIYKLGDYLVKRDMDKWAKTQALNQPIMTMLAYGENPHAKSQIDTLLAVQKYFQNAKEKK